MMLKKSIFISIPFLIIGCSSTEIKTIRLSPNILAQKAPGKTLLPKNKTTAHVGEVMFTAGEFSKQASTIKSEIFSISESRDIYVKHRRKIVTYHLKPMDFFLYHENNYGSFYKGKESVPTSEKNSAFIGLYVPKETNEAADFFWNWHPVNDPNFYQTKLDQPIKGIKNTKTQYLNDSYSTRTPSATVTYAGVSNGQIRFTYNEFMNDGYIKPAFTQEVGLDYKPNGTYSYKSALFKVYKADSSHINFEIIKPLD